MISRPTPRISGPGQCRDDRRPVVGSAASPLLGGVLESLTQQPVSMEGNNMDKETFEQLLFSLAWYDASAYHHRNVKDILAKHFPGVDFSAALDEFERCKAMPPGPGCPR